MINKKGFISISIVYSFFIIFLSLLILMMGTYVNNRITYGVYKNDIKESLSKNVGVQAYTYATTTHSLRKNSINYCIGSTDLKYEYYGSLMYDRSNPNIIINTTSFKISRSS